MVESETSLETPILNRQQQVAEMQARFKAAALPPSVQSLCLEQSLYAEVQLNPERDARYLELLKFGALQFDAHCVYCNKGSTFKTLSDRAPPDVAEIQRMANFNDPAKKTYHRLQLEGGQFALHLGCSRNPYHLYSYFFFYNQIQAILMKIGQTPSIEDVAGADIERYRKILGNEFAELRRATGLFAHGIGIGSFVYLRRIFETLVESARLTADPKGEREAEFKKMGMAERVKELAAHLPPAVVKYKETYGILSKGLHELTESECKKYFPIVRASIISMLEQRYEAAEKAKAAADLDRAVAAIAEENKGTRPNSNKK